MDNTQRLHKKPWKRPQRGLALFLRLWLPMKNLLLPLDIATMQKTFFFCMQGEAYKMWYTDGFGNVVMYLVECTDVISRLFHDSNTNDYDIVIKIAFQYAFFRL